MQAKIYYNLNNFVMVEPEITKVGDLQMGVFNYLQKVEANLYNTMKLQESFFEKHDLEISKFLKTTTTSIKTMDTEANSSINQDFLIELLTSYKNLSIVMKEISNSKIMADSLMGKTYEKAKTNLPKYNNRIQELKDQANVPGQIVTESKAFTGNFKEQLDEIFKIGNESLENIAKYNEEIQKSYREHALKQQVCDELFTHKFKRSYYEILDYQKKHCDDLAKECERKRDMYDSLMDKKIAQYDTDFVGFQKDMDGFIKSYNDKFIEYRDNVEALNLLHDSLYLNLKRLVETDKKHAEKDPTYSKRITTEDIKEAKDYKQTLKPYQAKCASAQVDNNEINSKYKGKMELLKKEYHF